VVELDWWQSHSYRGSSFTLTPAQHWSSRAIGDRSKTLWGAWAVLGASFHWYFGGDSGYCRDFLDTRDFFASRQTKEQGGGFDLALLAIGAYQPRWFMGEQHVDPFESVRVHQDLGAKRSLAIHWGTFALTDESVDTPADDLTRARKQAHLTEQDFMVLPIGGTVTLAPRIT
jgi:N-acyl-phosphatidylethanolamine-hydrolysing phospholipase D